MRLLILALFSVFLLIGAGVWVWRAFFLYQQIASVALACGMALLLLGGLAAVWRRA